MTNREIEVVPYDRAWVTHFETLKGTIWPKVADFALSIEHVGSTSVPGLCAKPIIDIDIVAQGREQIAPIITALKSLGYSHRGDLGIEGREAFRLHEPTISHNLYACINDCIALLNHPLLRDHLRENKDDRDAYCELKTKLAKAHSRDIDAYVEGKTKFITSILQQYVVSDKQLADMESQNQKR